MRVANCTKEAGNEATNLAKTEIKSAMNTKDFTDNAAQALKAFAKESGYSISDVISVARPILAQIAEARGVKLSFSDIDDLENSLSGIDGESNIVKFNDKSKKDKRVTAPAASASRSPGRAQTSEEDTEQEPPALQAKNVIEPEFAGIEQKSLPTNRMELIELKGDLKEILTEAIELGQKKDQLEYTAPVVSLDWAKNGAAASRGSFAEFLKAQAADAA